MIRAVPGPEDWHELRSTNENEALRRLAESRNSDLLLRTDALRILATKALKEGDYKEAISIHTKRAKLAAASGYPYEAITAYLSIASIAFGFSFDDGWSALKNAEEMTVSEDSLEVSSQLKFIKSFYLGYQGHLRKALDLVLTAEVEAAYVGRWDLLADSTIRRALLQISLGDARGALASFEATKPELPNHYRDRAVLLSNHAYTLLDAMRVGAVPQDWTRPRQMFEEAAEIARQRHQARNEMDILVNLLLIASLSGDAQLFSSTDARLRDLENSRTSGLPEVELARGRFTHSNGRFKASRSHYAQALTYALEDSQGFPTDHTWRARMGLAIADANLGRSSALDGFRAAMDDVELLSLEAGLRGTRARFLDDRMELFVGAVEAAVEKGRAEDGLDFAWRARTQLLRALQLSLRRQQLEPDQVEALEKMQVEYFTAKSNLEQRGAARKRLAVSERTEFDAATAELREKVRATFAAMSDRLDEAAPVGSARLNVRGVQRALGRGEVLLSLWGAKDLQVAFLVTRRKVSAWRLGLDPLAEVSKRLGRLPGRGHVYLVPGGLVSRGALVGMANQVLPEIRNFSFLPSASALLHQGPAPAGPAVVVADPSGNLPFASKEGEDVARRFEGAQRLVGKAATVDAVRARLDGARLFHFAGHGVLEKEDPWRAYLSLAGGGQLTLEQLLLDGPRIGLAVLSGCETGQSQALSRSYGLSLPEALLAAGTQRVLATLDVVNDASASRFIRRFYDHGGAERPSEGFRRALRDSLGTEDEKAARAFFLTGVHR